MVKNAVMAQKGKYVMFSSVIVNAFRLVNVILCKLKVLQPLSAACFTDAVACMTYHR